MRDPVAGYDRPATVSDTADSQEAGWANAPSWPTAESASSPRALSRGRRADRLVAGGGGRAAPAETALAILAEMTRERYGREAR